MTQEEKAKAYDKALALMEDCIPDKDGYVCVRPCDIFQELKESEDERIRKELIEYCTKGSCGVRDIKVTCKDFQKWVAWLKKQGEQPKKVSIWKHWKDGIAGGAEGEQIFLIKLGRVYSISSCLGCECDYIELSELDELMREEKSVPT